MGPRRCPPLWRVHLRVGPECLRPSGAFWLGVERDCASPWFPFDWPTLIGNGVVQGLPGSALGSHQQLRLTPENCCARSDSNSARQASLKLRRSHCPTQGPECPTTAVPRSRTNSICQASHFLFWPLPFSD